MTSSPGSRVRPGTGHWYGHPVARWLGSEILLALSLSLPGVWLAPARAESRPVAQFQSRAEVVQIGVSVTERGRYVGDLDAADFQVFEDGKRQELSFFDSGERPIALTLMIDASSSMYEKLSTARAAALRMIRSLRSNDVTQIVQFAERTRVLQELTSERAALEGALESVRPFGRTALRNAIYVVLTDLRRKTRGAGRRRHALVILSDGMDTGSVVTDDDVLALARRASIVIHTIGLLPKRIPKRERLVWGRAAHLLAALARDTGGDAHFPRSLAELEPVYEAIGADLRAQYSLGYIPSPSGPRATWRRITVRTPGRSELAVRHRTGYYASAR